LVFSLQEDEEQDIEAARKRNQKVMLITIFLKKLFVCSSVGLKQTLVPWPAFPRILNVWTARLTRLLHHKYSCSSAISISKEKESKQRLQTLQVDK